ncbi:peptidase C1A [Tanacetum coccineum]
MEINTFIVRSLSLLLILSFVESFHFHEKELESEEGLMGMYDRWRGHHHVEDRSTERFNVFKTNALHVHQTNKLNRPYKLELNPLQGPSNCNKSKSTYGDVKSLPIRVDWRKENAVTSVKAQDACEQSLSSANEKTKDVIGGFMEPAFKFIKEHGGLAFSTKVTLTSVKEKCVVQKSMFEMMLNINIVSCAMDATGDFGLYKSGVYTGQCGHHCGHAVTLVGYDETPEGVKYWIVKNSWSAKWGDKGYMLLERGIPEPEGRCGINKLCTIPLKGPNTPNKEL